MAFLVYCYQRSDGGLGLQDLFIPFNNYFEELQKNKSGDLRQAFWHMLICDDSFLIRKADQHNLKKDYLHP